MKGNRKFLIGHFGNRHYISSGIVCIKGYSWDVAWDKGKNEGVMTFVVQPQPVSKFTLEQGAGFLCNAPAFCVFRRHDYLHTLQTQLSMAEVRQSNGRFGADTLSSAG
mgnify:CR=1 FL=1